MYEYIDRNSAKLFLWTSVPLFYNTWKAFFGGSVWYRLFFQTYRASPSSRLTCFGGEACNSSSYKLRKAGRGAVWFKEVLIGDGYRLLRGGGGGSPRCFDGVDNWAVCVCCV